MSHMSLLISHNSCFIPYVSCIMSHDSYHKSCILHITCLMTYVKCHRSHVTSHRSCFSSHKSHIVYPPGATCNRVDGKCKCKPGYAGNRCEDHCPEGYFGADCYQACQCESENYLCHPTRGCVCQPRYGGSELFHFHFLFYNIIICR